MGLTLMGLRWLLRSPYKVISHISKSIFLADILWRLWHAGFADFGVTGGVEAGNKSCMSLIQGMDDSVTRLMDGFEFD